MRRDPLRFEWISSSSGYCGVKTDVVIRSVLRLPEARGARFGDEGKNESSLTRNMRVNLRRVFSMTSYRVLRDLFFSTVVRAF